MGVARRAAIRYKKTRPRTSQHARDDGSYVRSIEHPAAVGAVVEYAVARWPQHGSDINEHLVRVAREWIEQNTQIASASPYACRHTQIEWPGRLAADQPVSGGSGIPRRQQLVLPGFVPPTGTAVEAVAAASRHRRLS